LNCKSINVDQHSFGGFVLLENLEHERGDGNCTVVEEGGPDGGGEGDLLAAIGGVGLEFGVGCGGWDCRRRG